MEVNLKIIGLIRGRAERESNKKRKKIVKHTFTREELDTLYSKKLLTDKQISEIYKMTPEGILYQRKNLE